MSRGTFQHFYSLLLCAVLSACGGSQAKQAESLPPVDAAALGKMVQAMDAAKTPDGRSRAIDLLNQALAADPMLWEARYNLGVLLAEGGELAKAEKELAAAADLAPNAEDVAVALGEVRRRRADPKGAADGLKTFVQQYPKADTARAVLIAALREAEDYNAALDQARQILVRRADDPNALAELALTHLARGEVDTAELLSAEALKSPAPSAAAERTAGLIALERGDDAKAFRHFARASELDPADHTSRINMGNVLLAAGVYVKAEEHFRTVLAVKSDDRDATLGLAAALRGRGSRSAQAPYREAEKLLAGLLQRHPSDLEATFNLGVLYARFLGKGAEGKKLMERFVSEAPSEHPARSAAQDVLKGL